MDYSCNFENVDTYNYINLDGNKYTCENGKLKIETSSDNIFIDPNSPKLLNSIYEATICLTTNQGGFGLILRATDKENWFMIGYDHKGNWVWHLKNGDGKLHSIRTLSIGHKLKLNTDYKIKIAIIENKILLWIDNKFVFTDNLAEHRGEKVNLPNKAGYFGFRKWYDTQKEIEKDIIYISDIKITEIDNKVKFAQTELINYISSSKMKVKIDESFPRVIEYELEGQKKFYGQPNLISSLVLNGYIYTNPTKVEFEKVADNEAIYKIYITCKSELIESIITLKINVIENIVSYDISNIENHGKSIINSIHIPNLSIISVRSTQASANFEGTRMSTHIDIAKKGDINIKVDKNFKADFKENNYMYGFVSNNEYSAAIWSNSENISYNRISEISYEGKDETGNDYTAIGLSSAEWIYQNPNMPSPELKKPSLKVIIVSDLNNDGKVDWQDGAIAYRKIMNNPKDYENIKDYVAQRIVMNFGSMATNPFLKTLDNLKRVYLNTDGLGQKILLKGYQSEGHDSAHPDYDEIGIRIGGADEMNLLVNEGKKYNSVFGVHINATETYPEAKAFELGLLRGDMGWDWLDCAYKIDTLYDLSSGKRMERLKGLKEKVPNLNFLYVDAWYEDSWQSCQLSDQINSLDFAVATEWAYSMEYNSIWSHWATDLDYGGCTLKGINSDVARFIRNHQKDVWMSCHTKYAGVTTNPLLGGYQLEGFEGWTSDNNYNNYIEVIFNTNLPTKFLQHYLVTSWQNYDDGSEKEIHLKSADNLHEVIVSRGKKPIDSIVNATRIIKLDNKLILEDNMKIGELSIETENDINYPVKNKISKDIKYLIPWNDGDNEETKLYHWNYNGGKSAWELPDNLKALKTLKLYRLTDEGRIFEKDIDVLDGKIILEADPKTPYVIYSCEKSKPTVKYGEYSHLTDPSFLSNNLNNWDIVSTGISIYKDPETGNTKLKFENNKSTSSISQKLTDLIPGKTYTAMVYVENQSDSKASIEVVCGDKTYSNYTYKSIAQNYVSSDSHHTKLLGKEGDYFVYSGSYMQVMQVNFNVPSNETTAKLTLKREAAKEVTYFDDIRIVETKANNFIDDKTFVQDFENVAMGIYPFVISCGEGVDDGNMSDNRTHLSERHEPFTQIGFDGDGQFKPVIVDDVINGRYSLKSHATLTKTLLYQTIPQNFRFEPHTNYKVSFKYGCGSENEYKIVIGEGEYSATNMYKTIWIEPTTKASTFEFELKGSESGSTWFGVLSVPNGKEDLDDYLKTATGVYDLVIDDIVITRL